MRITYAIRQPAEYISATTAKCQLPLYGIWVDLTLTSYALANNPFDLKSVAMSFGARPLLQADLHPKCSPFDATHEGVLKLARGTGGNRQDFEQSMTFPVLGGELFDCQPMAGGVPMARALFASVLRGLESVTETIRFSIRESFPDNTRQLALDRIHELYGPKTVRTLRSFLGQLHWRLLLANSGCDEQQFSCIEAMSQVNPPRFYDANYDNAVDILLVNGPTMNVLTRMRNAVMTARRNQQQLEALERRRRHEEKLAKANDKATSLLEQICGKDALQEFKSDGQVTIEQDGYKFRISANSFIHCTDPVGKRADLCIHSKGFMCNPIDEIIIAWLHIKHKLADYMKTAVLHGAQRGFQRLPRVA